MGEWRRGERTVRRARRGRPARPSDPPSESDINYIFILSICDPVHMHESLTRTRGQWLHLRPYRYTSHIAPRGTRMRSLEHRSARMGLGSSRIPLTFRSNVTVRRRCSLGFGLDLLGGRGLRQNDHVIKRGEPLEPQPAAGEHRDHQWLYE